MNRLNLIPLGKINTFVVPDEIDEITADSSALSVFTDFSITKPLIIESSLSALETERLMKKAHVRLKLVLNDKGEFIGIVSAEDLLERKIVQKLQKGDKRQDLSITDFMTPANNLWVLEFDQVKNSKIKHVIQALKDYGQQHCLVVESKINKIRGLFSVSDISRKLKVDIDIQDRPSFAKLASKLE